jgi:thiamine-phosphate pyrophosphorylase
MPAAATSSNLYLVLRTGPAALDRLTAALAAATPASLLVKPGPDNSLEAQAVLPLIKLAQSHGVAVLLADDAQMVRTTKADGVHLTWSKDLAARAAEARDILGHRFMLGVDCGRSRHEAMEQGEAGADYVAFGIPAHVEDRDTAKQRREELCEWWGAIFQVPCVAFDVDDLHDARRLAELNADFVAVDLPEGLAGAELQAFVTEAARSLDRHRETA